MLPFWPLSPLLQRCAHRSQVGRGCAAAAGDHVDTESLHLAGVFGHDFRRPVVDHIVSLQDRQPRVALGIQNDARGTVRNHLRHHRLDLVRTIAAVGSDYLYAPTSQGFNGLFGADAHHGVQICIESEHGDDGQIRRLFHGA